MATRGVGVEIADGRAEEEHDRARAGRAGARRRAQPRDGRSRSRPPVTRRFAYSFSSSCALRSSIPASTSTGTYSTSACRRVSTSSRMRVLRAAPLPSSTSRTFGPKASTISAPMRRQHLRLGAHDVVLRQEADGVEQRRPERVVEPARRQPFAGAVRPSRTSRPKSSSAADAACTSVKRGVGSDRGDCGCRSDGLSGSPMWGREGTISQRLRNLFRTRLTIV